MVVIQYVRQLNLWTWMWYLQSSRVPVPGIVLRIDQCCGSELIFFGFVFGSTNFFSDSVSDPYTNILTRIFLKWCLSLLSFVFWNLYDREKSFPTEKRKFFVFQVFDLRFFIKFFSLQQCLDPNPNFFRIRIRIQPKYSDYFVFGSTTLVWIHSKLDSTSHFDS
jgi:hypothetical protein